MKYTSKYTGEQIDNAIEKALTGSKDGVSATHSWTGTTLTITSASGTSSADLKGEAGKSAYGYAKEGGYAGTEAEFAEDINPDNINQNAEDFIRSELAKRGQLKPEPAQTLEDMKDTSLMYVLCDEESADDGYIFAWMAKEEIVTNYENLAKGYTFKEGYRLNSSGVLVEAAGVVATETYIPFAKNTVVRIKGFGALTSHNLSSFGSTQNILNSAKVNGSTAYWSYAYDSTSGVVTLTSVHNYNKFLRISGTLTGKLSDVIITIGEEITDPEIVKEYAWRNTGHHITPLSTEYEERLNSVEKDVAQAKIDISNLKTEVGESAGTNGNVTIPSYWKTMVENKTETVKALQTVGGKNCVSFAWAADTHIPDNSGGNTTNIGKVMARMLDNCEIPFAVISGDINTRASYATEAGLVDCQAQMPIHLAPLWGTERLLMALGNHDGCYGDSAGYYRKQFTPERMWQIFFRGQALDFRRVFSDDGSYFYVDNIAQKTRFIVLNSQFGGEYAVDENGYAVNNRFATSCYGQAQLDWLADVALDMPEGYGAIITAHVPPNISYTVDKAQFIGIVNAYNNKTTYSGSYAGVEGWTSNSVSVDFTSAKGEIIAMFTGHVHGDSIDTTTMDCPILTILSAGATANEHNGFTEPEGGRTAGTDTETSFDVVTINRAERKIYCTRVGAGTDREISY
jgi:hypothetical protein